MAVMTVRAYHSDEWVVPQAFGEKPVVFNEKRPGRALREGKKGRTCFAKDGEFTLLPASLVYVGFRWH